MGVRLTRFPRPKENGAVFIETGTYEGETLSCALGAGFERLYSVEYVPRHYERAARRFLSRNEVILFLGSSPEVLPRIIDRAVPTTFWLDAHWQGGPEEEKDPRYGQCPLMAELRAIFAGPWSVPPLVLIDDAHMFLKPVPTNFEPAEWPTLAEIKVALPPGYSAAARIDKNRIAEGPCHPYMEDNVIYCTVG